MMTRGSSCQDPAVRQSAVRVQISTKCEGLAYIYRILTLPETNIAHENPHLSW